MTDERPAGDHPGRPWEGRNMGQCCLAKMSFAEYRALEDAPLSDLDRQVLDLSVRGCSVVEISMRCHCSTATVSRRRQSILRRMGKE